MASLLTGFTWFVLTRGLSNGGHTVGGWFHVGFYGTIFTGVLALALGFLVMGFLWLTLDLQRPTPDGVEEDQRNLQLFVLWLGIPLGVIGICAIVAVAAIVIGRTVYHGGLH